MTTTTSPFSTGGPATRGSRPYQVRVASKIAETTQKVYANNKTLAIQKALQADAIESLPFTPPEDGKVAQKALLDVEVAEMLDDGATRAPSRYTVTLFTVLATGKMPFATCRHFAHIHEDA